MIQLFVIFSFFAWTISLLGLGCFASEFVKKYLKYFEIDDEFKFLYYGTLGLMIISVIGTIFNFFIPLNSVFSSIILLIGIILFFVYRKNILPSCHWVNILIVLILFFYCAILSLMDLRAYDTGLYHLPMINWISNFTLPFGLANLHIRFGFNSLWFIDAAIIYPLRLVTKSPFFILNAILFFFYGTSIFLTLLRMIRRKKIDFSSVFVLTTFIPWSYCLTKFISSPSPDVPIMLLTLLITFLLIKGFETKNVNYLFVSLIISFYAVTIKLSAIPYFAGIFLILFSHLIFGNKLKKKIGSTLENLNNSKLIFASIILLIAGIPYSIRGIISSGYLVFPSTFGHFNFKWGVSINEATNIANWVKSWARKPKDNPDKVLGNWDWLNSWLHNIANDKVLIYTAIVGILVMAICFILKKKKDLNILLFVLPFPLIGCLFWFFSAPNPRFGYGYLFSLFGILISYGIYNFISKEKNIKYFLTVVCLMITLTLIYKNNISFKEMHDINKIKNVELIEEKIMDQIIIYVPRKGDQCFDGPSLCTPQLNKNLRIDLNKNNEPTMFWIEK